MALSPKQIAAINELIQGKSIAQVAKEVGINEKTIDRWLSDNEDFAFEYENRKLELLESGYLRACSFIHEALDVMAGIMRDSDSANRDRIAAAKALLSEVSNFERLDTALRLKEIEESQKMINAELSKRGEG